MKLRPWRSFRLNECVCGPYGADFDGDDLTDLLCVVHLSGACACVRSRGGATGSIDHGSSMLVLQR